ncbi:hypothetical protein NDU88_004977 [Pleurodeles waltl]|uniref:Uncharacterized protein n=1 Tax=Pleurodeles waltl TaxID=8319 RepID=A0AAV7WTG2_PLEWA|nr:hypothetical protein NDU88_004977 [Pleurodeles waltl]
MFGGYPCVTGRPLCTRPSDAPGVRLRTAETPGALPIPPIPTRKCYSRRQGTTRSRKMREHLKALKQRKGGRRCHHRSKQRRPQEKETGTPELSLGGDAQPTAGC